MADSANEQTRGYSEGDNSLDHRLAPTALPACHPGLVGPLPALAVVVTVAESLVDCLLSGACAVTTQPQNRSNPSTTVHVGRATGQICVARNVVSTLALPHSQLRSTRPHFWDDARESVRRCAREHLGRSR